MSEVVLVALITATATLLAGLGGVVVSQAFEARRLDHAAKAAADERVRDFTVGRLNATRRYVQVELDLFCALATGDNQAAHDALVDLGAVRIDADLGLLGDAALVDTYQATLVALRGRYGRGLERRQQVQVARTRFVVDEALVAQIERCLSGRVLQGIGRADMERLLVADQLADRLRVPHQPPSLLGRLARVLLERRVPQAAGADHSPGSRSQRNAPHEGDGADRRVADQVEADSRGPHPADRRLPDPLVSGSRDSGP